MEKCVSMSVVDLENMLRSNHESSEQFAALHHFLFDRMEVCADDVLFALLRRYIVLAEIMYDKSPGFTTAANCLLGQFYLAQRLLLVHKVSDVPDLVARIATILTTYPQQNLGSEEKEWLGKSWTHWSELNQAMGEPESAIEGYRFSVKFTASGSKKMLKGIFFQWSRMVMLMGDGSLAEVQLLMAHYLGWEVQHIEHFVELAKTGCGYQIGRASCRERVLRLV